ncbi:hypothetical protein, partial [Alkalibacillus haloalkaliphilus]|uniref:hypothetical protein n=1 Tax=Alkalibacillus haloalkaliphilus TaxID=94136 RepID=UPI0029360AA3
ACERVPREETTVSSFKAVVQVLPISGKTISLWHAAPEAAGSNPTRDNNFDAARHEVNARIKISHIESM